MYTMLLRLTAALLCALLLLGSAMAEDALIAAPDYPDMPEYPGQAALFSDDSSAYDAWRSAVDAQHRDASYAEGLTPFLYRTSQQILSGAQDANRVYSPLSLYMAAAMLTEATAGETRAELLALLGCDDIEALRAQSGDLWNANYRRDGLLDRTLATSVWLSNDVPFRADLLHTLADVYYAASYSGHMGSEEMDAALQQWLNEATAGLLSEQAQQMTLPADTLLALASAVAFQGRWADAFVQEGTAPGVFHAPGGDVTCDFMHQQMSHFLYSGKNFSAVSKDFSGEVRMWFILPEEGVAPESLLYDSEAMAFMFDREEQPEGRMAQIYLSVPKFDVSSQLELSEQLRALGVESVFDSMSADFSPLTDADMPICLDQVRHDARVRIDENGCEAAAYTVMILARSAYVDPNEIVDFTLDRPFLFIITGADELPLFVGIVNQP